MKLDREDLITALSGRIPEKVATALVDQFLALRVDTAMGRTGGSSAGKFVEAVVQALQAMEGRTPDSKPRVEQYLRDVESRNTLDDGLRICAGRIVRSMYALRNRRSIAHLGDVDPSRIDLNFLLHAAQWVLTEFLRVIGGLPMDAAGKLISQINRPVGGLVDDFSDRKLVTADLSATAEVLVLLHHNHPSPMSRKELEYAMNRRHATTVRKALKALWKERLIDQDDQGGYRLTTRGYNKANAILLRELKE
jgi:hypothetical protein